MFRAKAPKLCWVERCLQIFKLNPCVRFTIVLPINDFVMQDIQMRAFIMKKITLSFLIASTFLFSGCSTSDMTAVLNGLNQGLAQSSNASGSNSSNSSFGAKTNCPNGQFSQAHKDANGGTFYTCRSLTGQGFTKSTVDSNSSSTPRFKKGCDLDEVNRRARSSASSSDREGHAVTIESC